MKQRIYAPVKTIWCGFWDSWIRLPVLAGIGAIVLVGLAMGVALHVYGLRDQTAPADVIVVLLAGVEEDSRPTKATARRVTHAAALYHAGYAPAILCTGGYALPRPISEASVCREVLLSLDVPDDVIWLEEQSKSTEENAIFAGQVMEAQGWRSALVTSDNYHLLRAQILFWQHQVPVAGYSPAQTSTGAIPVLEYVWSVRREVVGFFWQGFKTIFALPHTHVNYF